MKKPRDIRGRDSEWSALRDFALADAPAGGVGLIYGRRRTGKSFLLRRLVRVVGGTYFQATESERPDALVEFGAAISSIAAQDTGGASEPIVYRDWSDALSRRSGLVVIDEFPYLLNHSPELPSLLQRIVDDASNNSHTPVRFLLCGSSLSVMTSLLSGQQPLRGRATLDLFLRPMDHRDSAKLWGVKDLDLAIRLDAIFGGAPGYRALTTGLPETVDEIGRWLSSNVMNPNHALYREDDYLLQEERTITDRALYGSLLRAIAAGVATQTELGARLQRSRESLTHPLATLVRAGFVVRHEDLLHANRPEHRLADPIIRFMRLVVDPSRHLLDEGRWQDVWDRAGHRLDANIYGPHLEHVARRWGSLNYRPHTQATVSSVGHTRVADPRSRTSLEIDLVATGQRSEGSPSERTILLLGEVKWSPDTFGPNAIQRLVRARELLTENGYDTADTQLALISRTPPTNPGEGLRIGLPQLYRR